MMRRLMACVMALAMFGASAPAHAEPTPVRSTTPAPTRAAPLLVRPAGNEPSVAQVEALVGAIGVWSGEYAGHLDAAGQLMNEVDGYTAILDQFAAGDLRRRAALERLEAWRVNAVARGQALRVQAATLRPPPSLALMGEQGIAIEGAFAVARSDLVPLIDEMIVSLESLAAFGVEAIGSPTKAADTRLRAIFTSAVQMVRIDERRIRATSLALAPDHPNRAIMEATLHYYAALSAMPSHELRVLDGAPADHDGLTATLRQSAQDMRASLAQSEVYAQYMINQIRNAPRNPATDNLRRVILEMAETFPPSIASYRRLADTLDNAARSISGGESVIDTWAAQEGQSLPIFEELTQYENRRIALAAQLRR